MAVIETQRTASQPGPVSRHEEKATAFFSVWAIIGLYLDGWAHIHDKPESFFSPWHGVLYSGVGAAVAYFAFREYILRKPSAVSDRLLTAGFIVFATGAGLDFAWHEIFGIEVGLEALLSPTHLMLLTGGVLMVSYPVRAAASRPGPRKVSFPGLFAVIVSLTITAALVQFFMQFFAAHRFGGLWPSGMGQELFEVGAIGAVFVTNAILLAATFIAVRRWDTPLGTFALMYGVIATGVTGMFEFNVWQHIPAAIASGLFADLLVKALRPSIERRNQALVFAALIPLVMWGLWLGAMHIAFGVRWSIDLWAGTVYLSVLEGVGLAVLAFPKRSVLVQVVPLADVRDEPLDRQDQV